MAADNFKDRIYHVEQETYVEREKREAVEAEQTRVERSCLTYGEKGRAYGDWIPKTREKIDSATS